MEQFRSFSLSSKNALILHAGYWLIAGAALFFIFSNLGYAIQLRIVMVILLLLVSYFSTGLINKVLVPKLLFTGKLKLFFYGIFGLICTSLWLILIVLIFSMLLGIHLQPGIATPERQEVIILIFTNYLIVIFASVVHFVNKSHHHSLQKNRLEVEKAELALLFKNAQKHLLQSQIHPHFMFNMLNSLYALSSKENLQLRKVILELSALLEYMLYDCRAQEVDLKKEIAFLEHYISLERIRHDNELKIDFETSIPEDNIQIAPLILFPFVENAFKHGSKQNSAKGYISIQLTKRKNMLEFEVINNIAASSSREQPSGIGLQNIRERLNILYPHAHELQILPASSEYRILLRLKLTDDEEL